MLGCSRQTSFHGGRGAEIMEFPIEVKVRTNCSTNKLFLKDDKYVVELNAKPKNNEANLELIKFLSKKFKMKLRIIRGFKSRMKLIDVV